MAELRGGKWKSKWRKKGEERREIEKETRKFLFQIYRVELHFVKCMTIKNVKLASHQILLITKGKT